MNSSVKYSIQGEDYILTLEGVVDESTPFPDAMPSVGQRLIFSCKEVRMVNSIGISHWLTWIRKLHPDQQIHFRQCARKVVDIINYLDGFLTKNSTVESFYVPFECVKCSHESDEEYIRGKDYLEAGPGRSAENKIPETINCPNCNEEMESAVLLQNYLRFLKLYNAQEK